MFPSNPMLCYAEIPPVAQMTGYKMKTTFWGDFRVCKTDESAIRDTFRRSMRYYKDDREYGTELALVLNWLSWLYNDYGLLDLSRLYVKLWQELDGYIMDNWKGEDLSYYLRTTD